MNPYDSVVAFATDSRLPWSDSVAKMRREVDDSAQ